MLRPNARPRRGDRIVLAGARPLLVGLPGYARRVDVARARLYAQALVTPLASPAAAVTHLVAVQAQDVLGACWGVGQRSRADNASVGAAFDRGEILRTHVMRPTWHFVTPADVRWLLALTAARIHSSAASYYRSAGLTAPKLARYDARIADALRGGQFATREELAKRAGVREQGQALSLVMIHAELEQVIISGPRQGKQQTYALFDERVPRAKPRSRDAALAELARRYVTSHGPALPKDLAWWGGLTLTEARRGLELAGDAIAWREPYFVPAKSPRASPREEAVHLLPNFDELVVAFVDRTAAHDDRVAKLDISVLSSHLVVSRGMLIGGYQRRAKGKGTELACTLWGQPTAAERAGIELAAARYAAFTGAPATATIKVRAPAASRARRRPDTRAR